MLPASAPRLSALPLRHVTNSPATTVACGSQGFLLCRHCIPPGPLRLCSHRVPILAWSPEPGRPFTSGGAGCLLGAKGPAVGRTEPTTRQVLGAAGITWGKVVSLYSVAAGLAVDCVRQAQPAMVHALVDCLGEFVRKTLATWLRRRGGWTDVLKCVVSTDPGLRSHWLVAVLCSCGRFLKAAFFMLLPER
ncbi:hypothetical protein CB1_000575010 [Camelus ferus]|nr:hypothetical protein CB1_000575010 [Camelus ferus]